VEACTNAHNVQNASGPSVVPLEDR
jgi:hypothetical protein